MNKLLIVLTCFIFTLSSGFAARVIKTKGKIVLLSNGDGIKKGSILKLKDGKGKTQGIIKVIKVKSKRVYAKLLRGKAKKGWRISKVNKKSKSSKKVSIKNLRAKNYFAGGVGIYATSADSYDGSLLFNLEYGLKIPSLTNWIFAATFMHSTQVLNETTFTGTTGNFSYKETTMHFIFNTKYKLSEMFYINAPVGYFISSGNMTNLSTLAENKLEQSGFILGGGFGIIVEIDRKSFIDLNLTLLNYSASSVSFNGTEQSDISASDRRTSATASYAYRF